MGKRGPKKDPIEVLEARGSARAAGRRAAAVLTTPESTALVQRGYPQSLKPQARPFFDGVCRHLENIGRLREAFSPAAILLANLQSDLDEITQAQLQESDCGDIDPKVKGLIESRRSIRHMALVDRVIRLMDRFYMTPGAMEGVSVPRPAPKEVKNEPAKAPLRGQRK